MACCAQGPEIFGMHDNAEITSAIAETTLILETALSLQVRLTRSRVCAGVYCYCCELTDGVRAAQPRDTGAGGESWDVRLARLASDIRCARARVRGGRSRRRR